MAPSALRLALLRLRCRLHTTAPARPDDSKPPIIVYRGAECSRVDGISWSRSRPIVERFATGERGDVGGEPVIATALVPRRAVLMYVNDRNQREVLLDPRRPTNLTVLDAARRVPMGRC